MLLRKTRRYNYSFEQNQEMLSKFTEEFEEKVKEQDAEMVKCEEDKRSDPRG